MARTTISLFTHVCAVRDGPLAGNKRRQDVDPWEYAFGHVCDNCGEPLATTEQLLEHIYRELTE